MEYVSRIDGLLEASLGRETLTNEDKLCRLCNRGKSATWRCKDCSQGLSMCRGCIRLTHKQDPFHRIEQWNGHFFRPAELWEVGIYVLVRHHAGTSLCDTLIAQERFLEFTEQRNDDSEQESLSARHNSAPISATSATTSSSAAPNPSCDSRNEDIEMLNGDNIPQDGDDEEFLQYLQELHDKVGEQPSPDEVEVEDDVEEEEIEDTTQKRYLPEAFNAEYLNAEGSRLDSAQQVMGTYIRVVHTNGIHNIAMISCECRGHDILPYDLLAARLLPASFDRIRTIFSAQLLDHFRLCNLELKATAYQFYHLLKRLTNPMGPAEVVDLYREFRRMSRIWRWMKRLKWAGIGNKVRKAKDVKAGELTIFCPACPQPGVNIPENWKEDPAR